MVAGNRSAGNIAVAVPIPTSQSPSVRPWGERSDQPNRAAPTRKHSSRCLLDHCRSLPGGAVELFRCRSSIGSMFSATASSSIALSSAKDPGASPGARMNVVGGMFSGTIFWLMARFRVAYHSREVPCDVGSTNDRSTGVLHQESWRNALRVPSCSAPRAIFCTVAARPAVAVKTCSRLSAALTGLSRALAAAAARNAGVDVRPLPPNAPPTNGFTACTRDCSVSSAPASSTAWRSDPWFPLWIVRPSGPHTATAECGSIAAWFWVAVVYVASTTTGLAASASSMDSTSGARTASDGGEPSLAAGASSAEARPSCSEVRAGRAW
ncbi:hypothetical protein HDA45_008425 [Amycolatopsis umgeniensis]|uniref:Uncharacterized protein n=1 Tax=Amycolatopsis umgeniensis TaxID=336628 RepID=A0A841BHH5_9PSEU|nr:hypothetical protein [Amycolatopsis umgeniensis]